MVVYLIAVSDRIVEVATFAVVIDGNRTAINPSVKVRTGAVVVSSELVSVHRKVDMATVAVMVEGVLLAITAAGEVTPLIVIEDPHGALMYRTADIDVSAV